MPTFTQYCHALEEFMPRKLINDNIEWVLMCYLDHQTPELTCLLLCEYYEYTAL